MTYDVFGGMLNVTQPCKSIMTCIVGVHSMTTTNSNDACHNGLTVK